MSRSSESSTEGLDVGNWERRGLWFLAPTEPGLPRLSFITRTVQLVHPAPRYRLPSCLLRPPTPRTPPPANIRGKTRKSGRLVGESGCRLDNARPGTVL
ncbi:hypothetical protein VZT92_016834 [Zoarces viviparus]|uniref:Uncharacterized protein n=1 Tax=Zoarces viviparus TaxID=48416 RepID=A0AAW1ET22_ZOAVI